jgi:SAM-dependent methyltransferase
MNEFWDNRYSSEEFIYGTEPNEFFRSEINRISPGRLLALAEGEGRNGIYAASLGWKVDAVDFSSAARTKALKLASQKNTDINYVTADLKDFEPEIDSYDAVSMIFMHLNPEVSGDVHKRAVYALRPGGRVILEVYAKEQLGKSSGGPQNSEMLYSIEDINQNFAGLKTLILTKEVIHLNESRHHSGEAVVIRFVGEKV